MTAWTTKFLKAAEGRTVRRPEDGSLWPEAGDWAENTIFIRRRIEDGDLVEADPPKVSENEPELVAEAAAAPTTEAEPPRAVKAAKAEK